MCSIIIEKIRFVVKSLPTPDLYQSLLFILFFNLLSLSFFLSLAKLQQLIKYILKFELKAIGSPNILRNCANPWNGRFHLIVPRSWTVYHCRLLLFENENENENEDERPQIDSLTFELFPFWRLHTFNVQYVNAYLILHLMVNAHRWLVGVFGEKADKNDELRSQWSVLIIVHVISERINSNCSLRYMRRIPEPGTHIR